MINFKTRERYPGICFGQAEKSKSQQRTESPDKAFGLFDRSPIPQGIDQ